MGGAVALLKFHVVVDGICASRSKGQSHCCNHGGELDYVNKRWSHDVALERSAMSGCLSVQEQLNRVLGF